VLAQLAGNSLVLLGLLLLAGGVIVAFGPRGTGEAMLAAPDESAARVVA
jgi:hypothetical protein